MFYIFTNKFVFIKTSINIIGIISLDLIPIIC